MSIKKTDGVMYVRDKNAYMGPRTHELVDKATGQLARFTFQDEYENVEIPVSFALPLVEIDGFEVRQNPDDPMPIKSTKEKDREVRYLAPDEVIAKFSDLSRPALIRMAKAMGMTPKNNTTNDEIIQFIMGGDQPETEEHAIKTELENE